MRSPISIFRSCLTESGELFRLGDGLRSRLRMAWDVWLLRLRFIVPESNTARDVCCQGNARLRYRLNRGDLQGLREVWCNKVYRLPFDGHTGTLVDLGANIGLTSVWLQRAYRFDRIIAVEPDPANAALVRENFALNDIRAEVIEAAVGPADGTACFSRNASSNLGHVVNGWQASAHDGVQVPMVSMDTILGKLPEAAEIDVLKLDIEGGEAALLLEGSRAWLARVSTIIAELHPEVVDCDELVRYLESQGFDHIPPNSVFPENMTAFVRRGAAVKSA